MKRLEGILRNLGNFSEEECQLTLSNVRLETHKKGTALVKEGKISKNIFFIASGYMRTYQLIDGRDKTISFGKPGQFMASTNGLVSNSPSDEYIETVSDVEVMSLDAEKLEYLQHSIPKISFLINIMLKEILECKEERIKDFINLNATDRYRLFVEHIPDLIKVVSINHLASYLGTAPETLSRIRSKIIF